MKVLSLLLLVQCASTLELKENDAFDPAHNHRDAVMYGKSQHLQRKLAGYGARQRIEARQAEAKKQAAIAAYMAAHAAEHQAAAPKTEESKKTSLLEMDPKAALAAAKRTHGDNARFGKLMALQRKKAAYGALQRTLMKQAEAKKQAAIAAYEIAHEQEAAAPKTEKSSSTSLLEMDPKAAMAAAKRTHGDNARFGKLMALQRKKAAYGALQRTLMKQAEAKKQASIAAYEIAHEQEAAVPKTQESSSTSLLEMDPKAAMAAAKRTHGDNARFGKLMALQRKKAAYGALQRTVMKQAEAKKQAAVSMAAQTKPAS